MSTKDADFVAGLQSQIDALQTRVKELEAENAQLLSQRTDCSNHEIEEKSHGSDDKHMISKKGNTKTEEKIQNMPGYHSMLIKHGKRYVALKVMYFGKRFYGFSSEAQMDPTVESEIFKALEKTRLSVGDRKESQYSRCGRTDKGVSSVGQVIALFLRSNLKVSGTNNKNAGEIFSEEQHEWEIDYAKVLNRVLPNDIRILGWCPVPVDFHARFSCLSREYKYFFWRENLNIQAMERAAKKFLGEHDFRNFCKMDAANVHNYRRHITMFDMSPTNVRATVTMSTSSTSENSASLTSSSSTSARTYALFSSSGQTSAIKLDRSNFLVWESIVLPLIEGNQLEAHINGTVSAPARFLTDGSTPNPAFATWFSVDRLLVGWLRNTMTQDVAAQLLHCKTAEDLWMAAKELTCAATKARVMVIKNELHQTRKNTLKMDEYLNKMKTLADELTLAGSPVATDDLILHTLNGLDADYNAIVVKLLDKTGITWVEAQVALLAFESRLDQLSHFSSLSVQPTANVAQSHDGGRADFSRRLDFGSGRSVWRGNRFRGGRGRGRRANGWGRDGRSLCHYCNRSGHTIATCYQRASDLNHTQTFNNSHGNFNPQAHYADPYSVSDPTWYMDSGANYHVTPHSDQLDSINPVGKLSLLTCTDQRTPVMGIGSVSIPCSQSKLHLKDVLYVPTASKNLMSVNRLIKDNQVWVSFTDSGCDVKDKETGQLLMQGTTHQGLYPMKSSERKRHKEPVAQCNSLNLDNDFVKFHRALGHPSLKVLKLVMQKCNVNLEINDKYVCEACQFGKSRLLPFSSSASRASHPLELIHTDLWGPSPICSSGGHRFYVLFVDDFSRYTWIYPLKHKSDTIYAFKIFRAQVENQFSSKIKFIQCDNGSEFKPLASIAQEAGIQMRFTCPYTSAQNGRAERKHRHVVEMGLTLLAQANMPLSYWVEAFQMAVFIINRLPTPVLSNTTPLFQLLKKEPDYKALQPFGCACYPCLKPFNSHKFQFHSQKCAYLGVAPQHKGHRCLSSSGKIFISRHVVFDPSSFPFASGSDFCSTRVRHTEGGTPFPMIIQSPSVINTSPETNSPTFSVSMNNENGDTSPAPEMSASNHAASVRSISEASNRSERTSTQPTILPNNDHPMVTRAKDGITKPKHPFVGLSQIEKEHLSARTSEPLCVQQALQISHWRQAMSEEFYALMRNHTWQLVPFKGQKVIDCKWVFKTKFKADSTILKHKARLVAKGFQQTPGVDFGETFSPVIKTTTIRVVLTMAVTFNWPIKQLDVNNAFLNGYLKEEVYMRQPDGFVDPQHPHHVCRLVKAIYGLKQAPRAWFERLRITLLQWGFQNARSDISLFTLHKSKLMIYVLIYVDDILVTGNNSGYIDSFVGKLNSLFMLKDLGPLYYFLGLEIHRDSSGIYLGQTKYVLDLLKKFGMLECAPVATPMVTGRKLSKVNGELMKNPTLYRQAIGSLQYLTTTRPDIAFSVNKLSQFLSQPREPHFQAVKRIFRYLKGTISLGLHLTPVKFFQLIAYTDADWATDEDDRRSIGGICIYFGGTLVSWSSKKQHVVSRSSAESEYRVLADGAAEVKWLHSLMTELGLFLLRPSVMWCDNMSAKALASNPVQHSRSKHIDIDIHFIRDFVHSGHIQIRYIPSEHQTADLLTKALTVSRFQRLRDKLGMLVAPSRLRGNVRK